MQLLESVNDLRGIKRRRPRGIGADFTGRKSAIRQLNVEQEFPCLPRAINEFLRLEKKSHAAVFNPSS